MSATRGKITDAQVGLILAAAGALMTAVGAPLAFEMFGLLSTAPVPGEDKPVDMAQVFWFAAGVLLAIAGVWLSLWRQYRNQARIELAERTRAQNVTRFTDELGSTLDVLVDFARSKGKMGDSEVLIKNVLREGRRLYAHPGVRLCLYIIESTEAETEEEKRDYLVLKEYDGRRDAPRAEFAEGAHSDCLLSIAQGNNAVAVPDPSSPPAGISVDYSEHSGWKSFLAVPLIRGRDHLGVLLIDTRDQTDFKDEDKSIGWTISRLLVHGLQVTEMEALELGSDFSALAASFADTSASSAPGGVGSGSAAVDAASSPSPAPVRRAKSGRWGWPVTQWRR